MNDSITLLVHDLTNHLIVKSCCSDMINFNGSAEVSSDCDLCDHRPLQMKEDDYQRACQIPKRKV